jgi:hypothetical protein
VSWITSSSPWSLATAKRRFLLVARLILMRLDIFAGDVTLLFREGEEGTHRPQATVEVGAGRLHLLLVGFDIARSHVGHQALGAEPAHEAIQLLLLVESLARGQRA